MVFRQTQHARQEMAPDDSIFIHLKISLVLLLRLLCSSKFFYLPRMTSHITELSGHLHGKMRRNYLVVIKWLSTSSTIHQSTERRDLKLNLTHLVEWNRYASTNSTYHNILIISHMLIFNHMRYWMLLLFFLPSLRFQRGIVIHCSHYLWLIFWSGDLF